MRKIAFIPGDGVGIDVAVEAEKVLEAVVERSALELQVDHFDYGAQKYLDSGVGIPDEQIEDFQRNYAAIFIGALGDPAIPDGKHVREILLALRLKLDLFVNYSPIKLLSSKHCPLKDKKPEDIDFVVFRENLEGVNAFIGGTFREGTAEEELIQQSIISRRGMRRILQHTFEFARHKGMKKVIICNHRPPQIFPLKLWTDQINEIGREFPNLEKYSASLPELLRTMLQTPEELEVVLSCNNFGGIITDLGVELQGGVGLAVECNLNPGKTSVFMPVHGPLSYQAGAGTVNPLAAISATAMMLEYLGFEQEARWVNSAVNYALDTDNTTSDLGGRLGSGQVGDFITDQIRKGAR